MNGTGMTSGVYLTPSVQSDTNWKVVGGRSDINAGIAVWHWRHKWNR